MWSRNTECYTCYGYLSLEHYTCHAHLSLEHYTCHAHLHSNITRVITLHVSCIHSTQTIDLIRIWRNCLQHGFPYDELRHTDTHTHTHNSYTRTTHTLTHLLTHSLTHSLARSQLTLALALTLTTNSLTQLSHSTVSPMMSCVLSSASRGAGTSASAGHSMTPWAGE